MFGVRGLDYQPFSKIENEMLSKQSKKNELTHESHPSLSISYKSNTVSYLVRYRRSLPDLSIQAQHLLENKHGIGYFEVKVKSTAGKGSVSIGLASFEYSNTLQPGWSKTSYAYHSDDGRKYHNSRVPAGPYHETFREGDVVGCGVNFNDRTIFFTKNGSFIDIAFHNIDLSAIYPTIGLDRSSVQVIFDEGEFAFNINDLRELEVRKRVDQVECTLLESCNITDLIKDYLYHEGYATTYKLLLEQQEQTVNDKSLSLRGGIRDCILNGRAQKALELLSVKESLVHPTICLLLHSQVFLEFIERDTLRAISYAQEHLFKYVDTEDPVVWYSVSDLLGLIAYKEPLVSPLKHLFSVDHKERVIQTVNDILMNESQSVIERSLKQLMVAYTASFST